MNNFVSKKLKYLESFNEQLLDAFSAAKQGSSG
jgi:hypothetical protein